MLLHLRFVQQTEAHTRRFGRQAKVMSGNLYYFYLKMCIASDTPQWYPNSKCCGTKDIICINDGRLSVVNVQSEFIHCSLSQLTV